MALAASWLALGVAWAEAPSAIAIKDAHIVRVSGDDIPKGTVLLRDGLIQDVGVGLAIPADAWIIDGNGLTVYPGFIDGLSTWGLPTGNPAPPAPPRSHGAEDRPQTYSFERAADLVTPSDTRLEAARAAGFTTSATFPNRGIVEGLGALINLAGERGRDMVVAQPIGEQIVFRISGGFSRSGYPSSLMGNIAYVRQLFMDLDHYKQSREVYTTGPAGKKRPEYDHNLEGLAEAPRILLPATQAQQIDRILDFGQELKRPYIVYGLHEGFERIEGLKRANVPLLVSLKWPEKPKERDPNHVPQYRELLVRDKAPAVAGMLAKAGVKFAFYSDGVDTAPELKKAVKKAMDAGLTRAGAIRALTLSPAEMYGMAGRLGSIEKGKIANLTVTRGEVFEDKTSIEYVFVDGRKFEPSKEMQQGPPPGSGEKKPTGTREDSSGGDR